MGHSADLFVFCQSQIRLQAVRGLKPLLRGSRIGASASSSGTNYTTRASHPVAATSIAPNPGTASSAQTWRLASLAAGAVAAGAVAAHIAGKVERVPITGRPQLIFDMFKSAPGQRAAMPAAPDLPHAYSSANPYAMCSQHGDEVLHAAYDRVAEAVAGLAANDPVLQSRLASTPDRIDLLCFSVSPDHGMQSYACGTDGKLVIVPPLNLFHDERVVFICLMAHGGSLHQQSTADEVVASMAKELAHVIASHSAEQKSCPRLINLLLLAIMTAAVMSGVIAWSGIPLVMLASYIGDRGASICTVGALH